MAKLSTLIYLNTYEDQNPSNSPNLNNFKWNRSINSIQVNNPTSESFTLAPGESRVLFNGTRSLSTDNTTMWDIALKPLSSNTYVLTASSGTLPNFRTPRSTGTDATTEVSVTVNGPLTTFTSTGGTLFSLGSTQVGDYARIGDLFNVSNQGEFKILAKTTTSFTVELYGAVESSIVLGAGFADQVQIYTALEVQKNDTLVISGGFSEVTQGSYKITDVAANYIEFYSTEVLPEESSVQTDQVHVYFAAKKMIYMESNQKATLTLNDEQTVILEPIILCNSSKPGIFMLNSTVYSLEVENSSTDSATLFLASVE